ncbi:MAG: DUF2927 domain-containing protein [Marinosulfonomonas sp.]
MRLREEKTKQSLSLAKTRSDGDGAQKALALLALAMLVFTLSASLVFASTRKPSYQPNASELEQNFMEIALKHEYGRNSNVRLLRWERPIKMNVIFGASVDHKDRHETTASVKKLTRELSRLSGMPISVTNQPGNFFVVVADAHSLARMGPYLKQTVPGISSRSVSRITNRPRHFRCMVVGVPFEDKTMGYRSAVAIIPAGLPAEKREACIQEEISQGLGLPNDFKSNTATVFNDDEQYLKLTPLDKLLVRTLYDRRLKSGMQSNAVSPVLKQICNDLVRR